MVTVFFIPTFIFSVELIYSAMLITVVQQNDSDVCVCVCVCVMPAFMSLYMAVLENTVCVCLSVFGALLCTPLRYTLLDVQTWGLHWSTWGGRSGSMPQQEVRRRESAVGSLSLPQAPRQTY